MNTSYPDTPNGKRTIRTNVWGNVNGYVSGKLFWEFGADQTSAQFWVEGNSLDRAYCECWIEKKD